MSSFTTMFDHKKITTMRYKPKFIMSKQETKVCPLNTNYPTLRWFAIEQIQLELLTGSKSSNEVHRELC